MKYIRNLGIKWYTYGIIFGKKNINNEYQFKNVSMRNLKQRQVYQTYKKLSYRINLDDIPTNVRFSNYRHPFIIGHSDTSLVAFNLVNKEKFSYEIPEYYGEFRLITISKDWKINLFMANK